MEIDIRNCELMTAMVTPFTPDGQQIDEKALAALVTHLLETGTDCLVIAGTTGEGSALTLDEKKQLIAATKQAMGQQEIPIMVATGTNTTQTTIELSQQMVTAGANALLVVTPYYVKPSQEGLYQHFKAVAESVPNTPIVLYNIPSRTVVGICPKTMARLAKDCPNIVGVKQSCADMDTLSEIITLCGKDFTIWSGDDSLTLPMMALGAVGVISVASHLFGLQIKQMIAAYYNGQIQQAKATHLELFPEFRALFEHPNPMVVKQRLSQQGLINNVLRLPLVSL